MVVVGLGFDGRGAEKMVSSGLWGRF